MTLAENIVRIRKMRGMTQEALADKIDVSRNTLIRWETGETKPSADRLRELCLALDVTADELLDIVNMSPSREGETDNVMGEGRSMQGDLSSIKEPSKKERRLWKGPHFFAGIIIGMYILIYLWGRLTNSPGLAKGIGVLWTVLLILGALLYCTYSLVKFLRKDLKK